MKKFILLLLCLPCALLTRSQASITPDLQAAFDEVINAQFKPDEPGGAVLITQQGKIIYERAFGMANLELNVKMKPDMVFCIGSITKQFTAVCILQLAEAGKLSIHDTISKFIPDAPTAWQAVTLEHLLTHTSGITDEENWQNSSPDDLIKRAKERPLAFQPATKFAYNNIEYVLLGNVVAKVSGLPFSEYAKKNLLLPLGMTHTYFDDNSIIPNRVSAYLNSSKRGFQNVHLRVIGAVGEALFSNTQDLFIWHKGLLDGKLIKKEILKKAWTSYRLTDGKEVDYGYGWQTGGVIAGSPIIEHGGLAVGYSTDALYLPGEDMFVAVFMNQRSNQPEIIAAKLTALALGKPDTINSIVLSDSVLRSYTGVYIEDTVRRHITFNNHSLYYQREGSRIKMEMKPYATDKFFFENTSVIGETKRNAEGRITALWLFNNRHPFKPTGILNKIDPILPAKE